MSERSRASVDDCGGGRVGLSAGGAEPHASRSRHRWGARGGAASPVPAGAPPRHDHWCAVTRRRRHGLPRHGPRLDVRPQAARRSPLQAPSPPPRQAALFGGATDSGQPVFPRPVSWSNCQRARYINRPGRPLTPTIHILHSNRPSELSPFRFQRPVMFHALSAVDVTDT